MPANPDFKELLSIFNEEHVEYLVAGAHAVIYHTEPRYTKATYDGVPIPLMGKASLIKNKQATGRPQDLLDVTKLQQ